MEHPSRTFRSIFLLAGSFVFAFLLGEAVHELGHYLAHLSVGNTGIGIHLDPFGGSRIVGVNPQIHNRMGYTSAAGPLLNLLSGFMVTAAFWRGKKPARLPLLIWGPLAAIQEGVNFTLGLMTPGGDGSWIIKAGLPRSLLLFLGCLLLLGGVVALAFLLLKAGLAEGRRFWERTLVLVCGIGVLMAARSIHSVFISRQAVLENFVPLVFSLLLSALVAAVQSILVRFEDPGREGRSDPIPWRPISLSMFLAGGIFLLQILAA